MSTVLLPSLFALLATVRATIALDGPALVFSAVAAAASVIGNVLLVAELVRMRKHLVHMRGEIDGLREALGITRPTTPAPPATSAAAASSAPPPATAGG